MNARLTYEVCFVEPLGYWAVVVRMNGHGLIEHKCLTASEASTLVKELKREAA
jgi:hypothetical protein